MTWRRAFPTLTLLAVLAGCAVPAAQQEADTSSAAPGVSGDVTPAGTPGEDRNAGREEQDGSIPGVQVTSDLPNDHVEGPLSYDRTPPVGGTHNPRWLACAVYDTPVPPEFAVHSLEHGAVWLAHRPDVDRAPLAALQSRNETTREYVLVSPQDGLPAPVVAVAWGRSLEVSDPTDPRLEQFVRAYAGGDQGGEPGAPCARGGLTPGQAQRVLQPEA